MALATLALCAALLATSAAPAAAVTGEDDFDGPTDVTLYLYTQGNPTTAEFIKLGDDSASPSFNPENPTRFITHGLWSKAQEFERVRDAYLATGNDYNIVLVDWSGVANLETMVSANTSVLVADYVGQVLNYMMEQRGLDAGRLFLVGHSMGGQISGIIGNRVGGAAAEIVGLDPASEIYDFRPLEDQLDASDAQFVQVIHTNGLGLGVDTPHGHVDFYVNGGHFQPGCGDYYEGKDGCSHMRVVDLFIESLSSDGFVGTLCDSYEHYLDAQCSQHDHIVMGEETPTRKSGTYYLETNAQSPYALGEIGL